MTEEEKIVEQEKSRDKYFYIDKEKTCQVLTGIATSFIGASIAILLFTGTHKPPCSDAPQMMAPPCHCKMMRHKGPHGKFMPPRGEFKGPGKDFRGHGEFKGKHFPQKGEFNRPDRPPVPPAEKPVKK